VNERGGHSVHLSEILEWPPHRRGFFVIDPLTGQNKQNRLGRPWRVI